MSRWKLVGGSLATTVNVEDDLEESSHSGMSSHCLYARANVCPHFRTENGLQSPLIQERGKGTLDTNHKIWRIVGLKRRGRGVQIMMTV